MSGGAAVRAGDLGSRAWFRDLSGAIWQRIRLHRDGRAVLAKRRGVVAWFAADLVVTAIDPGLAAWFRRLHDRRERRRATSARRAAALAEREEEMHARLHPPDPWFRRLRRNFLRARDGNVRARNSR
jgi:hypothetical protein